MGLMQFGLNLPSSGRQGCAFSLLASKNKGEHLRYGIIELTQGNLNNAHLYLTSIMELFPAASVGGSSATDRAPQLLEIHSGIGEPALTDIAGDKKIFRSRAWVGDFFSTHQLKAGDSVVVERTGTYRYHVYPKRASEF